MMRVALLLLFAGCALGADAGVLTQPTLHPKGGSGTVHLGFGDGGMSTSDAVLAVSLDSRVDIASGGSRWNVGASALGGVHLPGFFPFGRVGVWRAIVSGATENAAVPSFELGAFIPTSERYDAKHPQYGASVKGFVVGIREDIDDVNYFTVFVGGTLFVVPGY